MSMLTQGSLRQPPTGRIHIEKYHLITADHLKRSSYMLQTCLRRTSDMVAVAIGDTLQLWERLLHMPPTLQVVWFLLADSSGKLSLAFGVSEMIHGNFFRCKCPSVAWDADA